MALGSGGVGVSGRVRRRDKRSTARVGERTLRSVTHLSWAEILWELPELPMVKQLLVVFKAQSGNSRGRESRRARI